MAAVKEAQGLRKRWQMTGGQCSAPTRRSCPVLQSLISSLPRQPPEELIPEIQEEEDVEIVQDRRRDLIAVRLQEQRR